MACYAGPGDGHLARRANRRPARDALPSWAKAGPGGLPNQLLLFAAVWLLAWAWCTTRAMAAICMPSAIIALAAEFAAVPVRRVEWTLVCRQRNRARASWRVMYTARGGAAVPNAGAGIELQDNCLRGRGRHTRHRRRRAASAALLLGVAICRCSTSVCNSSPGKSMLPWSDMPWQFECQRPAAAGGARRGARHLERTLLKRPTA